MTGLSDQLSDVIRATQIRSLSTFSWYGTASPRLPTGMRRRLSPAMVRTYLVGTLADWLYAHFYCAGRAVPMARQALPRWRPGGGSLAAALDSANAGIGHWQDGWRLAERHGDALLAVHEGLTVLAGPGEWRADIPNPRPGDVVALRWLPGSHTESQGFYVAHGDTPFADGDQDRLVRLYWHLRPGGAVRYLRTLTARLNRLDVPFTTKVLEDESSFTRCDAGVLYLRRSDYHPLRRDLADIHAGLGGVLDEQIPALTKRIAEGVGLAEGPGGGVSFGRQRCGLIAEGLVAAEESGCRGASARLAAVIEAFRDAGLDPDAPHLEPASARDYEALPVGANRAPVAVSMPVLDRVDLDPLAVARGLGEAICASAIWHDDRCTWVDEGLRSAREVSQVTEAVPVDLYRGSAGIGLFLGELGALSGRPDVCRTAVSALRQALCLAGDPSVPPRAGLYTGPLGVAVAAARVGRLLDRIDLVDAARCLVERVTSGPAWTVPTGPDLLTGDAGTVVALVLLAELLEMPQLTSSARSVADELAAAAQPAEGGLGWPAAISPGARPLTGFSHGAAGIGYALTLACRALGDDRYKSVVAGAFRYEQRWYDSRLRNWADLRDLSSSRPRRPWPTMTAWCHGAPGIALARALAAVTFGQEEWREQAVLALEVTAVAAQAAADTAGSSDFSLCHGLAGLADTLRLGWEVLEPGPGKPSQLVPAHRSPSPAESLALAVAGAGRNSYAEGRVSWPCGTRLGTSPSLLLGLAGIGNFYLRLHEPAIASPLLPDPTTLSRPGRTVPEASTHPPAVSAPIGARPLRALLDRFALSDQQIRALVADAVRRGRLVQDPIQRERLYEHRWALGRSLRDRTLPRRLPAFAAADDHLRVADDDPGLWDSLPYMLSFGYDLAEQLLAAEGSGGASDDHFDAYWTGAVFSALLSVFDYLVDETPAGAPVYEIEPGALDEVLTSGLRTSSQLAGTYGRIEDSRLRLLVVLFGLFRDAIGYRPDGEAEAWTQLASATRSLFAAERAITQPHFTSLSALRRVAADTTAVGVLPFEVLSRAAAWRACGQQPSMTMLAAATQLGRMVGLADDLADLLPDCDRSAPNQVALRLADALDAGLPPDRQSLSGVLDQVVDELRAGQALLASFATGEAEPGALAAYARETVIRWLDVGPADHADLAAEDPRGLHAELSRTPP